MAYDSIDTEWAQDVAVARRVPTAVTVCENELHIDRQDIREGVVEFLFAEEYLVTHGILHYDNGSEGHCYIDPKNLHVRSGLTLVLHIKMGL